MAYFLRLLISRMQHYAEEARHFPAADMRYA